jgi:alpha-ribazole phosphatase
MKLWLVRHAAVRVAPGICYGSSDVQAKPEATLEAAQALAAAVPAQAPVWHSPLQRCERLAQSLCGLRPDLTPKEDARLAEMDFGEWEGCAWGTIGQRALAAWTDAFWTHRPGGGETVAELMGRVAKAFDEARDRNSDCVWITHAGVIRAAHLVAGGTRVLTGAGQWPTQTHAFGAWGVLEI